MRTVGGSVTKRMLSPVSWGCKQNVTLSFFTIPILSILLYSACSSAGPGGANTKAVQSSPVTINDYDELNDIKNNGLNKHYRLGNDIDASESWGENDTSATCVAYNGSNGSAATCTGFTPIGNSTTQFTGSFDGDSHKITNLYIKRSTTDNVGLFGSIASSVEIKNIGVTDAYIVGNGHVGGLIGYSEGSVSNSYAMRAVTGGVWGDFVGGLIGYSDGFVNNSYAMGAVMGAGSYVGGLIGGSFGSVSNSYATGDVTGSNMRGSNSVGGLIGTAQSFGSVGNSYATGDVMGTGNQVGGLIGYSFASTVSNSYATGAVMGVGNKVGGLIGESSTSSSVTGKNYFADTFGGTNGLGSGVCSSSSACEHKTVTRIKALSSTSTPPSAPSSWTVSTSGSMGTVGNWNFGTTRQLPAVLYSGAGCETIATNDINSNDGDAKIPDCGDIIKGQR